MAPVSRTDCPRSGTDLEQAEKGSHHVLLALPDPLHRLLSSVDPCLAGLPRRGRTDSSSPRRRHHLPDRALCSRASIVKKVKDPERIRLNPSPTPFSRPSRASRKAALTGPVDRICLCRGCYSSRLADSVILEAILRKGS